MLFRSRLFELVEEAAGQAGVSVIITTHSPALLDAIGGAHARDVLVCHDGQVTRMPDLPGYDRTMARAIEKAFEKWKKKAGAKKVPWKNSKYGKHLAPKTKIYLR